MKNFILVLALLCSSIIQAQPVRLAVAGIAHGHNGWILGRKNDAAIRLGIGRNTITRKIQELGIAGTSED